MRYSWHTAALLAAVLGVASWAFAGSGGPSGPNVSGGKNPHVSLHTEHKMTMIVDTNQSVVALNKKTAFEVPQGKIFVLNEVVRSRDPATAGVQKPAAGIFGACTLGNVCILADGNPGLCVTGLALANGVRFDGGTKIEIQAEASATVKSAASPLTYACTALVTLNGFLLRQ